MFWPLRLIWNFTTGEYFERQVRFLQAVFSRPSNVMYLRAMRGTPGTAAHRLYRRGVRKSV